MNSSTYDKSQSFTLDPTRKSHRELFRAKNDKYIDQLKLEETVNTICNSSITRKEIDWLDETIIYVLNAARKHVEGIKRTIPILSKKVKLQSTLLYYAAFLKKKEGKRIDEKSLEGRQKFLELERENLNRQEAEEKYNNARLDWEAFKNDAKKEKEKDLLDLYPTDISRDIEISQKRRKKAIAMIKKGQFR